MTATLEHPAPGFVCGAKDPKTGRECDLEPGTHRALNRRQLVHATSGDEWVVER